PRPKVDFACVREHVTMEQVLQHLGCFASLRGRGQQRRGPCPVHSQPTAPERTFSVHLGKNAFQCFHAECAVRGMCWICGLRSIACRCTRPPWTWPRPSRFPGTEKT